MREKYAALGLALLIHVRVGILLDLRAGSWLESRMAFADPEMLIELAAEIREREALEAAIPGSAISDG